MLDKSDGSSLILIELGSSSEEGGDIAGVGSCADGGEKAVGGGMASSMVAGCGNGNRHVESEARKREIQEKSVRRCHEYMG